VHVGDEDVERAANYAARRVLGAGLHDGAAARLQERAAHDRERQRGAARQHATDSQRGDDAVPARHMRLRSGWLPSTPSSMTGSGVPAASMMAVVEVGDVRMRVLESRMAMGVRPDSGH
jgi:hypothetical protein